VYVALLSERPRPGLLCITAVPGNPLQPDGGSYDPSLVAPRGNQLTLSGGWFGGSAGAVFYEYGQTGPDVTSLEFRFRRGQAIKAVLHNRWYLVIRPEAADMPLTAAVGMMV
jgi:hypothetical protein